MEQHHFDIVNHATPRLESMDKALGRGKYTDDLELPNMAYAALVRCPYSHAEVLSIDVSGGKGSRFSWLRPAGGDPAGLLQLLGQPALSASDGG